MHVLDAAQEALELVELVGQPRDFFFGQQIEGALLLHALEFAQPRDALLNRGEVGQRSAQPALIDEVRAGALGFFFDDVLRLLLGADEQNDAAVARELLDRLRTLR